MQRQDTAGRLYTIPYQDVRAGWMSADLRAACCLAIHVRKPDGEILRAGVATLYILDQLGWPGMRLLARRPFIWVIEAVYRLVANNRLFFSRFLFRD